MQNRFKFICAIILGLFSVGSSRTYYVSTTGNSTWPGTMAQPFSSIQEANAVVVAGDSVFIRGGVYSIVKPYASDAGILISKSGTSDSKRIYFWAYPGERPIFDFANLVISASSYTHGFVVSGSWLHFKGLEIRNVPMNTNSNVGFFVKESGDNIFEQIESHHNNGSGFFVNDSKGRGGHLFLNCDAHDNYDPNGRQGDGQNADGFGYHYQTSGKLSIFRGCRAWWNSDDGWDLISQEMPVLIENSWAMGNGYSAYGTKKPTDGNGNGFKAGSSKNGVRHTIQKCVAWKNRASGFYANHSAGGNNWYNNTSYMNGSQYNMLASSWDASGNRTDGVILTGNKVHVMKNNIGYPNKNASMEGVDTKYNSWDLNLTPRDQDFLSLSDPSMTVVGSDLSKVAGAFGPRKANGDLPDISFLKLAANSQFIDKGADVGLAFNNKPDLGANEFAMVSQSFTITTSVSPGGRMEQNPKGSTLAKGSKVVFTAVPLAGWKFNGWTGDYTSGDSTYTIGSLEKNVIINANFSFVGKDSSLYEAEDALLDNAVAESSNTGFSGKGYANFENMIGSSIEFAIVVENSGEQNLQITYSNGSSIDRPVSLSVNGKVIVESLTFPTTDNWNSWKQITQSLELTGGVNTIKLTSLSVDGGPNIDKVDILKDITATRHPLQNSEQLSSYDATSHVLTINQNTKTLHIQLINLSGGVEFSESRLSIRAGEQIKIPIEKLNQGTYILKAMVDGNTELRAVSTNK